LAPRHQLRQLRHIGRDPARLAAISAARFSGSTTLTVPPPVMHGMDAYGYRIGAKLKRLHGG